MAHKTVPFSWKQGTNMAFGELARPCVGDGGRGEGPDAALDEGSVLHGSCVLSGSQRFRESLVALWHPDVTLLADRTMEAYVHV